ncbi:hypothetical protein ACQV88_26520, partial [Ralstonia pseudosolanacearum]|uniref:hypothetical protein n=1 Tax=Ralstonia pseudosolanacearum TaxID=1310165 RepID=UPI003D26FF46
LYDTYFRPNHYSEYRHCTVSRDLTMATDLHQKYRYQNKIATCEWTPGVGVSVGEIEMAYGLDGRALGSSLPKPRETTSPSKQDNTSPAPSSTDLASPFKSEFGQADFDFDMD